MPADWIFFKNLLWIIKQYVLRMTFNSKIKCFKAWSTMLSFQYSDQMVCSFCTCCTCWAHASVSNRVILTESEPEIAFMSNFLRVSYMSLQEYLASWRWGWRFHLCSFKYNDRGPILEVLSFQRFKSIILLLAAPLYKCKTETNQKPFLDVIESVGLHMSVCL